MSVLKKFRETYGLGQTQLAERLGFKQAIISKYENGLPPPPATAIQIERVLGPEVPAEALNPLLQEFLTLYLSRNST